MSKKLFSKLLTSQTQNGPIEAGRKLGMTPDSVAEKYLPNRNAVLSLLRIYSHLSLSQVAEQLGMTEDELKTIEESKKMVPFQLVPKLAKIFDVDLKVLLVLLGHAKGKDASASYVGEDELPWAAQYSGPDLTIQEKIDLEELFKIVLEKIKQRKDQDRK